MADVTVEFGATDTGLEKTLKAVQDELTRLKDKLLSGELSMIELESTIKRIGQVESMEKRIKAIGDSSTETSPKVAELNSDIKKTGDNSETAGKKAGAGFGEIALGAGIAGAAVKVGTAAIDAAFAAAQKTVQSFGDALSMGGRLADLSDRTGVAVDKVMLLERAFQNTGVGADSLGPIINKIQKAIVDAGDGTSAAADAFTQLGIPLSTLQDLSPDEQLRAIGKAIAGIPDPAERAAVSMDIFGESGGALNQLFANMDGEVETAKAQLGSLPEVMKAGAAQFDKISDNLTVIGGKFVEFAAGIIDKVKPALDALTTALTRIDAAKLGQDLAGFFIGAGEGMKGFQAAVDAISAGDMGTAFQIVGQAIQLQFKETANNVYTNMVAAFKTTGDFIMEQFASGGPLVALFQDFANLISGYISEKLYLVMADFMDAIGKSGMADTFRYQAETSANEVKTALDVIPIHAELTAEKAGESMGNIPENFKENMADVQPLFTDLEKHQQEIDRLTQGITKSQDDQTATVSETTKEQAAAEQEARKYFDEYQKGQAKVAEEDAKKAKAQAEQNALKQAELSFQLELAEAQAAGDSERVTALQESKKYAEDVQKALAAGLDKEQAATFATNMAIAANNSANIKQYDKDGNPLFFQAAENSRKLNENLKSATGFADTLSKMKEIEAMSKAHNSSKGAHDELKAMDKLLGTDLAQKSFPDLAKKLGVDKIGQTGQEQIQAVVAYMDKVKTDLSKNPIDSEKGQDAIKEIIKFLGGNPLKADLVVQATDAQDKIKGLGDVPVTVTATVDKKAFDDSIAGLNAEIKNYFTGGAGGVGGAGGNSQGGAGGDAGSGGDGGTGGDATAPATMEDVMSAIKGFVETIKDKVVNLDGKLPQPVLA